MKVELDKYTEDMIVDKLIKQISNDIFQTKKYWGNIPEEGCYSAFDKFKNQIAQLVADKILKQIIESGEVEKRIEIACDKAEKKINGMYFKKLKEV